MYFSVPLSFVHLRPVTHSPYALFGSGYNTDSFTFSLRADFYISTHFRLRLCLRGKILIGQVRFH